MLEDIVRFLKKSDSYLSGEEISQSLSISRAAIWKYMQELRRLGYEIAAVPHLGYQLTASPDRLFPWEVQFDLGTKVLGQKIVYEDSVPSTMDVAFKLGGQKAPEGTVVCAESQTKGRGRMGRGWVSPKGKGIYFSLILRPKLPPNEAAKLTLLCAVAVAEAVARVSGIEARIKWPNDLLVGKKKLAGILTELHAETDRVKFVVVGVGLNVNTPESQLPTDATSLRLEAGRVFSRVQVLQEVLRELEHWYLRFGREGFPPVLERWKELSLTLGRRVRVADPAGFVEGEAKDIDEDGGLLIRQDTGVIVKRMAGDVVWAH